MRTMLRLTVLASLLAIALANSPTLFKVIFQWNFIQYNWPSAGALEQAKNHKDYIAANNAIAGIKLWKDKMYLTIPRWKSGVPVTLAVTSAKPKKTDGNADSNVTDPMLDPYPSWDMQTLGDCNALQFVQSMEIDPLGRMWVLDTGRTETMETTPTTKCPPRLVILDLENNGAVLRSYVFPNDVAPKESAYLNDIVLDHEDGGMAFITDNGRVDPGIIVFSLKDSTSWKVRGNSMKAQDDAIMFKVIGTPITTPIHVDGIALSPPGPKRLLYYSPLSSFHLYSVPVSVLKNSSIGNIDNHSNDLGRKTSQTDGMIMTNQGSLYLGLLADDAIAVWDMKVNPQFNTGIRTITRDHILTQWPDSFAIDEEGQLWCVTNALQNFLSNRVDISQPNYRIIRRSIGAKNYQYFENGTAPELPGITGAADRINLALSSCLTITLVFLAR